LVDVDTDTVAEHEDPFVGLQMQVEQVRWSSTPP
jgi:hypothetical protein